MARQHEEATILYLYGTSSAGKGTIVKEILRQDKDKGLGLGWLHDGSDIERKKHPNIADLHEAVIASDSDSQRIYDELLPVLTKRHEILIAIDNGSIRSGEHELSLLDKQADVDAFMENLTAEDRLKYTRPVIEKLQTLASRHNQEFKEEWDKVPTYPQMMENVFQRAIENSRNGIPTIIDDVPPCSSGKYDSLKEFKRFVDEQNFSGPLKVVVAHCEVPQIIQHMDKRNKIGVEVRDALFPVEQYSVAYRKAEDSDVVIGQVSIMDIVSAANKYGPKRGQVQSPEDCQAAQRIMKNLGIDPETDPHERVNITTDIEYDLIVQTDPRGMAHHEPLARQSGSRETFEIAWKINQLAIVPNRVQPPLEAIGKESNMIKALNLESAFELQSIREDVQEFLQEKEAEVPSSEQIQRPREYCDVFTSCFKGGRGKC